jgi:predicted nucleic acid-binding protein
MRSRAEIVDLKTPPPRCRDPKDDPVLATAIDGQANVIVSGDNDLHADAELSRLMMDEYGVKIWRVHTLLIALENNE